MLRMRLHVPQIKLKPVNIKGYLIHCTMVATQSIKVIWSHTLKNYAECTQQIRIKVARLDYEFTIYSMFLSNTTKCAPYFLCK